MGRYSIKGSAAFDARLDRDFAAVAAALVASPDAVLFRALVLIGGYGRGEGTPLIAGGREEPFNDYDFVVVSAPLSRRRRFAVQDRLRELERRLSRELNLPVDLCLYAANGLPSAEFSLLNYEMRHGHAVVWGDPRVLDAMPPYPHGSVPLSEGTRLLLNRGKLLLDVRRALRAGRPAGGEERLRFVKFTYKALLAFGDCALLQGGQYDLRYAVKRERIGALVDTDLPEAAFVIERYRQAIALKEWGDYAFLDGADWVADFERVRRYFATFFRWYEGRRLGCPVGDTAAYAVALARGPRECPAWKAALLNVQAFGACLFQGAPGLLWAHPRARLYLSLPLLLGDGAAAPAELGRILGVEGGGLEAAEKRFYELQRRFS